MKMNMIDYMIPVSAECHKKIGKIAYKKHQSRNELVGIYINQHLANIDDDIINKIKFENEGKYVLKTSNRKLIRTTMNNELLDTVKMKCIDHDIYLGWVMRYLIDKLIEEMECVK